MMPRIYAQVFLVIVLTLPASASGADLKPPDLPDSDSIGRFLKSQDGGDMVIIQEWSGVEVRYSQEDGGLSGRMITVTDYCVRKRADLEEASTLITYETPRLELSDIKVEIIRGEQTRRFEGKDLKWQEITARSDGVVTLDGTIARAMLPGVMKNDRIRIVVQYELKGTFGLFLEEIGDPGLAYLVSGMEIRVPKEYQLDWGTVGSEASRSRMEYTTVEQRWNVVHRWSLSADQDGSLPTCKDSYPSLRVVPHVTHAGKDHQIDIACGSAWNTMGEAYMSRIDGVFAADEAISQLAARLTEGSTDTLDKIDRIYAEVQRRCRYLGLFEGAGGIIPIPAARVLESGFGDCKGLGTLLIALLREAGIEAYPVLVRTASAGPLEPEVPNFAQFNHYIAWADTGGGGIFLDGTVDYCPAGLVPASDAGSQVLLMRPGNIALVAIPPSAWAPGTGVQRLTGKIDQDGILNLDCEYEVSGNLGLGWRNFLASRTMSDRVSGLVNFLLPEGLPMVADDPVLSGLDAWRAPLTLSLKASSRTPLPGDGTGIFLPLQLSAVPIEFDPELRCGERMDLRSYSDRRETWRILLPEDFSLARPDSHSVSEDGLRYECQIWQDGDTLRVERGLRFTEAFVTTDQAEKMRSKMSEARRKDMGYIELRRQTQVESSK